MQVPRHCGCAIITQFEMQWCYVKASSHSQARYLQIGESQAYTVRFDYSSTTMQIPSPIRPCPHFRSLDPHLNHPKSAVVCIRTRAAIARTGTITILLQHFSTFGNWPNELNHLQLYITRRRAIRVRPTVCFGFFISQSLSFCEVRCYHRVAAIRARLRVTSCRSVLLAIEFWLVLCWPASLVGY